MSTQRRCSRTACGNSASATLTYVYAEQKAVIGPLAGDPEPHHYDLCRDHAAGLTVPLGWDVVRALMPQPTVMPHALTAANDDIEALAEAVREAARTTLESGTEGLRRGHLRVLRSPSQA